MGITSIRKTRKSASKSPTRCNHGAEEPVREERRGSWEEGAKEPKGARTEGVVSGSRRRGTERPGVLSRTEAIGDLTETVSS